MVWQYAVAAVVKAAGSYLGGKAQKEAAKEKAKLMREGILMRRGF